jgi:hypothetical protein
LWPIIKIILKIFICIIVFLVIFVVFVWDLLWNLKIDIIALEVYFLFVKSFFTDKAIKIKNIETRRRFQKYFWEEEQEKALNELIEKEKKQKNEKQEKPSTFI